MNRSRLTPHLVLLTLLSACQVGPDYEPPELDAPEQFDAVESSEEAAPIDAWWETFGDPVLTACIEEAFTANLDVRASLQRILAARIAGIAAAIIAINPSPIGTAMKV